MTLPSLPLLPLITGPGYQGYDQADIKAALSPEEWRRFCEWFLGQTGALTDDGLYLVYDDDWVRF